MNVQLKQELDIALNEQGLLKPCPICGEVFYTPISARLICFKRECEYKYLSAQYDIDIEKRKKAAVIQAPKPIKKERQAKIRYQEISPREGYVYLLKSDNGLFKIGKAVNVKKRLDSIVRDIPLKIEALHYFKSKNVFRAEKFLHKKYNKERIQYEWFSLDPAQVADIMSIGDYEID